MEPIDQIRPGNTDDQDDETGIELPEEESEETAATALLPLNFFQGREINPGTEIRVRIDKVLDGQAQVSFIGDEAGPDNDVDDFETDEGDEELAGYME